MITIVSGNLRCGSSLVMRMLGAAGVSLCYDREDSFEHTGFLKIVQSRQVNRWSTQWMVDGTAMKWMDPLLHGFPPTGFEYQVIALTRDPRQQARSQIKFVRLLATVGDEPPPSPAVEAVAKHLLRHNNQLAEAWRGHGAKVLELRFEDLIRTPGAAAQKIAESILGLQPTSFEFQHGVDVMARQVIRRGTDSYDGLLELGFDNYPNLWRPKEGGLSERQVTQLRPRSAGARGESGDASEQQDPPHGVHTDQSPETGAAPSAADTEAENPRRISFRLTAHKTVVRISSRICALRGRRS